MEQTHHVGFCADHNLPCWLKRKAARAANRELYPGQHLAAVQCGDGRYWHLMHLPAEVVRGEATRDGQPAEQQAARPNPTAAAQIRAMASASTRPATRTA